MGSLLLWSGRPKHNVLCLCTLDGHREIAGTAFKGIQIALGIYNNNIYHVYLLYTCVTYD